MCVRYRTDGGGTLHTVAVWKTHMAKKVGGTTYEGRYFIAHVPDDWQCSDPLPAPSPDDLWFDSLLTFEGSLQGPWDRKPVNRRPWNADPPSPAPLRPSGPQLPRRRRPFA
jgi:hypothetical protein